MPILQQYLHKTAKHCIVKDEEEKTVDPVKLTLIITRRKKAQLFLIIQPRCFTG